jgi:cystathionine beta-lyase
MVDGGAHPDPFEEMSLAELRARRSIKWRAFEPDVLPLWIAEMDARPPRSVVDVLSADLAAGDIGYPPMDTAYAEALADLATRRWAWQVDVAATRVCADVLTGIARSIDLLSEPGDVVVVPTPVYPPLLLFPREAGREVIEVPLTPAYRLDLEALGEAMAAPRARVLLLCSPHNPTGTVHTAEELRAVAEIAERHGVVVVVDEIHAPLVPEGVVFTPYLSVADGLVVTSASKAYNLAGLKAGVIVAGGGSLPLLERLPESVAYGASTFGVRAHIAAWSGGDAWLESVNAAIRRNVDLVEGLLAARLPGAVWWRPESTYLAWIDCRGLGLGEDPAGELVARGRVALNDGRMFGAAGAGFVRINLAASRATLTEAVDRMVAAVERGPVDPG